MTWRAEDWDAKPDDAIRRLKDENAQLRADVDRLRQEKRAAIAFWKKIARLFSKRARAALSRQTFAVPDFQRLPASERVANLKAAFAEHDIPWPSAADLDKVFRSAATAVDSHQTLARPTLRDAVIEFLAAEEAVEKEAARAEANGGLGWSSGPVVRRTYAISAMRAALNIHEHESSNG